MSDEESFEKWWARNHPWDWYEKELGEPLPTIVRLHIWMLAHEAWNRQDLGQRNAHPHEVTP